MRRNRLWLIGCLTCALGLVIALTAWGGTESADTVSEGTAEETVEETVEELSDIRWDAAPEEVLADDLLAHDHEKGGNE